MKSTKFFALTAMLALLAALPGYAADQAEVTVTIANGSLKLASAAVSVTDQDKDGQLTINDALISAHDAHYEGGSAAGFATANTDYGLSMTKLWGAENGSGFGYQVNNGSAMSLVDPIKDGDYIAAYVYTDTTNWSDTYCYFDQGIVEAGAGEAFTLVLSASGFDENWAPITLPVAGAVITVDGQPTEFVTDEQGKVTLSLPTGGIISAVSESQTLVPPVCRAKITGTVPAAPQTGDLLLPVLAAAGGALVLSRKKRM